MTPSKPEPVSDDGSKKAEPASRGSSDTIRQVAPDSRPGYGNSLINTYLPTLPNYNPTAGTMASSNPPAPEPRGHDFAPDGQRRSRRLSDSSSGRQHTQSPPPMASVSP